MSGKSVAEKLLIKPHTTLWTSDRSRPISQIALDVVWSALRFRSLRDEEAPFTGGR